MVNYTHGARAVLMRVQMRVRHVSDRATLERAAGVQQCSSHCQSGDKGSAQQDQPSEITRTRRIKRRGMGDCSTFDFSQHVVARSAVCRKWAMIPWQHSWSWMMTAACTFEGAAPCVQQAPSTHAEQWRGPKPHMLKVQAKAPPLVSPSSSHLIVWGWQAEER